MSANIPPQGSVKLTPQQQEEVGKQLDAMGVHIDPKELKTMTMDQLQKKLIQAGKPEAFEKVKLVMRTISKDGIQTLPKGFDKFPPKIQKGLENLFLDKFGPKEGPVKLRDFVNQLLQQTHGTDVPTGPALRKKIEEFLVKQHVPQVEAQNLAENVIQGESEGGLGSISSGGAETE